MKTTHFLAVALGLSACATAVAAPVVPLKDQPLYWGVSYAWADYTADAVDGEAATGMVLGRLGYEWSRLLSAELRYGQGVRDDNIGDLQVEIDRMYGIYGKVSLPTDINFTPYAIVGYSQGEATFDDATTSESYDDNGFSYGIGVDLCKDQPVCLNAEYIYYLSEDFFDVQALNVGLKVRF